MNEEPVYAVPSVRAVGVQDMSRVVDHLVHGEPFEAAAYCKAVKAHTSMAPCDFMEFVSVAGQVARAVGVK